MKLPEPGEWWQHSHKYLAGNSFYWWGSASAPKFIIEDVIYKNDLADSWVIYSNNDNCDYFVVQMWEFIQGDWEIVDGAR